MFSLLPRILLWNDTETELFHLSLNLINKFTDFLSLDDKSFLLKSLTDATNYVTNQEVEGWNGVFGVKKDTTEVGPKLEDTTDFSSKPVFFLTDSTHQPQTLDHETGTTHLLPKRRRKRSPSRRSPGDNSSTGRWARQDVTETTTGCGWSPSNPCPNWDTSSLRGPRWE